MEDTINYEKKVDAYRADMLPEELLILDSINAELKINKYSISWKTDNELLSIPDGFDLYGAEWKALFWNDIKTFSNKEVWEKFYKLKFDIEKRYLLPTILWDFEDPERKLSLDAVLNLDYEGIDKMLNSDDENQQRFCLNFIKDVATYTWLTTGMRMDLMKKINDTLIEKIDAHTWLAKEIEWATSGLFLRSDMNQETVNLSFSFFVGFFEWLPMHIAKEFSPYNWLESLMKKHKNLQPPNDINNLSKSIQEKFNVGMLLYFYENLTNFEIPAVSLETTLSNMESMIINSFPSNVSWVFFIDWLLLYLQKNNQIEAFKQIFWTFSESKRAIFIYSFLFSAQYYNSEECFSLVEELMWWDDGIKDILKALIARWESEWELHKALYNRYFPWFETNPNDEVRKSVVSRIQGQIDPYAYQVLRRVSLEIARVNVKEIVTNSKNISQQIKALEGKSLTANDIDRINELIQQQPTEELKQNIRYECVLNNPNEFVGKLTNFDTNQIFWFDKELFDALFANSPDRHDQQKLRDDLIRGSELLKETGNLNIIKDLFEVYNLTCYKRYSKEILKQMVENKDKPTWKPVFPIFMTKRDYNWALGRVLNDGWEVAKMMTEFDIRIFEPGDNNEKFFGRSGILDRFYTEYIAKGWKRENVNSMIGMHWNQFNILKVKPLNPKEDISFQDRDLFLVLSKYLKWWTVSLLSCSTWSNDNWESNVAQSAAKFLGSRVMAPHNDSNLESIVYNKSWWIEFTNYFGNTSTVIYDGREDIESTEDIIDIDEDSGNDIDILGNDGLWAVDFAIQTWSLWDVSVEKTETENKWKISKWTDVVFVEKKQNNWKFVLSIDATWSESVSLELPYTAFSKWLPKRIVDFEWNSSQEENNFKVESDSTIKLNIVKSGTWAQETSLNKDRIYNKGKNILIDIQEYTDVSWINIYDVGWKLVKNIMGVDHTPLEVDMNWAASGMYIVTINKSGLSSSTKIILP